MLSYLAIRSLVMVGVAGIPPQFVSLEVPDKPCFLYAPFSGPLRACDSLDKPLSSEKPMTSWTRISVVLHRFVITHGANAIPVSIKGKLYEGSALADAESHVLKQANSVTKNRGSPSSLPAL
jgi:hypothetical protein